MGPMDPLALYIHWPFCLAKCPYCDFNSHVRDRIDQTRFAAALRTELAWEAARLGPRRLGSIFFGGGTPSLMDAGTVADLIADAKRLFPTNEDIEITLEANPTSVEAAKLVEFRAAGVNRVSLGVQALDDAALAMLGRKHDARSAVAALELAKGVFERVSFDLIYARPGQSLAAWRAELRTALGSGRRPPLALPADDRARDGVRGAASAGSDRAARHGRTGRAVRCDGGGGGAVRAVAVRGQQLRRCGCAKAGTISPTGAIPITPASGRGRMGA